METKGNNPLSRPIFNDEASFEAVFKEFYFPLYRAVLPVLKNEELAEDLIQDLFIKLWNKRSSLFITGTLKAYLYKAAINLALDYLDKEKRSPEKSAEDFSKTNISVNQTESNIYREELELKISTALDKLPPACRTIFLLSREEELTYQEIAASLDISVKTVENQMGKALKILRQELAPYIKEFLKTLILVLISI